MSKDVHELRHYGVAAEKGIIGVSSSISYGSHVLAVTTCYGGVMVTTCCGAGTKGKTDNDVCTRCQVAGSNRHDREERHARSCRCGDSYFYSPSIRVSVRVFMCTEKPEEHRKMSSPRKRSTELVRDSSGDVISKVTISQRSLRRICGLVVCVSGMKRVEPVSNSVGVTVSLTRNCTVITTISTRGTCMFYKLSTGRYGRRTMEELLIFRFTRVGYGCGNSVSPKDSVAHALQLHSMFGVF